MDTGVLLAIIADGLACVVCAMSCCNDCHVNHRHSCWSLGTQRLDSSPLGQKAQDFFVPGQEYSTLRAQETENRILASVGQKLLTVHIFKRILAGNRRPTFSRFLGVLFVLDGLPGLGAKGA